MHQISARDVPIWVFFFFLPFFFFNLDPFLSGLTPLRGVGLVTAGGTETPVDFSAILLFLTRVPNSRPDTLVTICSLLLPPTSDLASEDSQQIVGVLYS